MLNLFAGGETKHRVPRMGAFVFQNMFGRMSDEGRLLGLNPGDWSMLVGGLALVALVALLL